MLRQLVQIGNNDFVFDSASIRGIQLNIVFLATGIVRLTYFVSVSLFGSNISPINIVWFVCNTNLSIMPVIAPSELVTQLELSLFVNLAQWIATRKCPAPIHLCSVSCLSLPFVSFVHLYQSLSYYLLFLWSLFACPSTLPPHFPPNYTTITNISSPTVSNK